MLGHEAQRSAFDQPIIKLWRAYWYSSAYLWRISGKTEWSVTVELDSRKVAHDANNFQSRFEIRHNLFRVSLVSTQTRHPCDPIARSISL